MLAQCWPTVCNVSQHFTNTGFMSGLSLWELSELYLHTHIEYGEAYKEMLSVIVTNFDLFITDLDGCLCFILLSLCFGIPPSVLTTVPVAATVTVYFVLFSPAGVGDHPGGPGETHGPVSNTGQRRGRQRRQTADMQLNKSATGEPAVSKQTVYNATTKLL